MESDSCSDAIKVAVCSEDALTLSLMKSLIDDIFTKLGMTSETEAFDSSRLLLTAFEKKCYELIFLDMDGCDGESVCVDIRRHDGKFDSRTGLIPVSDRDDAVFGCLKFQPVGFVRKREFGPDCERTVKDYLTIRGLETGKYLVINLGPRIVRVNVNSIMYVECIRDYQYFHTSDGEVVKVHERMKGVEDVMAPRGFIRVHKGYLVNFRYIESIEKNEITLSPRENPDLRCVIPVSRKLTESVKESYLNFARGNDFYYTVSGESS